MNIIKNLNDAIIVTSFKLCVVQFRTNSSPEITCFGKHTCTLPNCNIRSRDTQPNKQFFLIFLLSIDVLNLVAD